MYKTVTLLNVQWQVLGINVYSCKNVRNDKNRKSEKSSDINLIVVISIDKWRKGVGLVSSK